MKNLQGSEATFQRDYVPHFSERVPPPSRKISILPIIMMNLNGGQLATTLRLYYIIPIVSGFAASWLRRVHGSPRCIGNAHQGHRVHHMHLINVSMRAALYDSSTGPSFLT
jgi:hypothetical protein